MEQMSARMFPLGDIISVATDYSTSPRGMAGTRELLEHMVGHAESQSKLNKLIAESLVQAQTRPETNPSEGEPAK